MKHFGTRRLETSRLILRRFTLEDAGAMYENWARDPEVTKYLTWPAYTSVETAEQILAMWSEEYEKPDYYQWAIELKGIGQPVGSIAVTELKAEIDAAEIGYCIGRKWWHQGIMAEALQAVMDFLFDQVGVNRVECRHDANNPNSGRVMEKCGMKYEGTLHQSGRNNQGICDACWYGLLAAERKGTQKEYQKLVRDNIPRIIAEQGERANIRILEQEEYSLALERKLEEEVAEFHAGKKTEELADILEVVFALAEDLGCSQEELMEICQEKRNCRGGFRDRIFLISKEG